MIDFDNNVSQRFLLIDYNFYMNYNNLPIKSYLLKKKSSFQYKNFLSENQKISKKVNTIQQHFLLFLQCEKSLVQTEFKKNESLDGDTVSLKSYSYS
jgi:hypothetical protein